MITKCFRGKLSFPMENGNKLVKFKTYFLKAIFFRNQKHFLLVSNVFNSQLLLYKRKIVS